MALRIGAGLVELAPGIVPMGRSHRKHPHYAEYHKATRGQKFQPRKTQDRAHGLYKHVRPLTPKEAQRVAKRIASGVYANAH